MFKGSMVALVTPFKKDGTLDEKSFKDLINWHIKAKTDAIVLTGTTGEAPTLLDEEKLRIFEIALNLAKNKIKIIAGTGSYSTYKTKWLTQKAKEMSIDGALVVVPYYNKPTQAGILRHFEEIAKINLPIILYHHPGRTGLKLELETFLKLQDIKQIVAIKEASNDLKFAEKLINQTSFDILSGDDLLTIEMIKKGAKGSISVIANLIPRQWKQIHDLCLKGEFRKAEEIYTKVKNLVNVVFLETNPICVKYALNLMKKTSSFLRLPLIEPAKENSKKIEEEVLKNQEFLT